jgi:predicted CXXCH cytochrome family protein
LFFMTRSVPGADMTSHKSADRGRAARTGAAHAKDRASGSLVHLHGVIRRGAGFRVACAAALLGFATPSPAAPAKCTDSGCHAALVKVAHVHPPAAEGCENCHEATQGTHPDSTRHNFKLVQEGGKLCAQCHDAFPGTRSRHVPVAEGECMSCHDPHGSAEPKLLKRPLNDLCFECHERAEFRVHAVVGVDLGGSHPLSGAVDPARKGERFTCVSCHEPHASDSPRLWRYAAQDAFDLCGRCHAK